MNALCLQIQQEKNYRKFEELVSELSALVAQKGRRFPERKLHASGLSEKGWKLMPAIAKGVIQSSYPAGVEKVEISIPEGEVLFREIRVENSFVDEKGQKLAIKPGSELDVRLEAHATNLVQRPGRDQ